MLTSGPDTLILPSKTSGNSYRMHMLNNGILHLKGPVGDPATGWPMRTVCSNDKLASFQFNVDDADPNNPKITIHKMPDATFGRASLTGIFSPNGREWELTIQDSVNPIYHLMAMSMNWPMANQPTLLDSNQIPWQFVLLDSGLYQVQTDNESSPTITGKQLALQSNDDVAAYMVTISTTGLVQVDPISLLSQPLYDAQLVSVGGLHYTLTVDKNGVLGIDTTWQDILNQKDEWVVVLARNNNVLYVMDERFRPPVPGFIGRYGWRQRRYY